MRRMKNPPHKYKNLIKTKNFSTIQGDIYKRIDHKRMYKDFISSNPANPIGVHTKCQFSLMTFRGMPLKSSVQEA